MPTTSPYAFPYPGGTAPTNVPGDIQALAEAVDNFIEANVVRRSSGAAAARPPAAAALAGMMYRATDTGDFSFCDGTAWYPWPSLTAFLPTAGGTMSGDIDFNGRKILRAIQTEQRGQVTTVAASGANPGVDATTSPIWDVTLDQNATFTFAGNDGDILRLIVRQPASLKTVTWPATVDWNDGAVPLQAASTSVVYEFIRVGGRWLGSPQSWPWVPYVPVLSQSAALTPIGFTNTSCRWQRGPGKTVRAQMSVLVTGAGVANNPVVLSLPTPAAVTGLIMGSCEIYDASVNTGFRGTAIGFGTTGVFLGLSGSTSDVGAGQTGSPMAAALAAGDAVSFHVQYEGA